jgi:putative pyruvate formate lyase activating enzyme
LFGFLGEAKKAMEFLAGEISPHAYVNIMDQYRPSGKVVKDKYSEINRQISEEEYDLAVQFAKETGLYRIDEKSPKIQISINDNSEN